MINKLREELQTLRKKKLELMLLQKDATADFSYESEKFILTAGGLSIHIGRVFDIRTSAYRYNEFYYDDIPFTQEQNDLFEAIVIRSLNDKQIYDLQKQIEQEKKGVELLGCGERELAKFPVKKGEQGV